MQGKSRSKSQQIGEKSEALFQMWSIDNGLSSTKVAHDFGVDFFCQVFTKANGRETICGGTLAVQVKGTEGKVARPRITLERDDIVNLLRQSCLVCLIAPNLATKSVHFRFFDEQMVSELFDFLKSDKESKTFTLQSLESECAVFKSLLQDLLKPLRLQRLNKLKTQALVEYELPGASIRIHENTEPSVVSLRVPFVGSAFSVAPDQLVQARNLAFFGGVSPLRIPGLSLRSNLELGQDLIVIGGLAKSSKWFQVTNAGRSARLLFEVRALGDDFGYIHQVGISFVFTRVKATGSANRHSLSSIGIRRGSISLGDSLEATEFLSLLSDGAIISIENALARPIEGWGNGCLVSFGPKIKALMALETTIGLNLKSIFLDFIGDEESIASLNVLEPFVCHKVPITSFFSGFDCSLHEREINTNEEAYIRIPVAMNISQIGIVVWAETRGRVMLQDG